MCSPGIYGILALCVLCVTGSPIRQQGKDDWSNSVISEHIPLKNDYQWNKVTHYPWDPWTPFPWDRFTIPRYKFTVSPPVYNHNTTPTMVLYFVCLAGVLVFIAIIAVICKRMVNCTDDNASNLSRTVHPPPRTTPSRPAQYTNLAGPEIRSNNTPSLHARSGADGTRNAFPFLTSVPGSQVANNGYGTPTESGRPTDSTDQPPDYSTVVLEYMTAGNKFPEVHNPIEPDTPPPMYNDYLPKKY